MGLLLLVRHGQASFGSATYDQLSELGRDQSDLIGRRLATADLRVDRLVGGTLRRQAETASAITARLPAGTFETAAARSELDEYDHEDVLGAQRDLTRFDPSSDQARRRADQALDVAVAAWSRGEGTGYAETFHDFSERVAAVLADLVARPGTTVAVTSGGVITMMAAQILGLDARAWAALNRVMVNTSLTKVVVGRSGRTLVALNDHAHLEHDRQLITYR